MPNVNSKLIDLYRTVTWPWRRMQLRRMIASRTVPVGILFYHRVADDHLNSWTISNDAFREQIDWFRKNFEMISLAECQRRIRDGVSERPALAITFDDGYGENCEAALPLLIGYGIPVTYFVTLDNVVKQVPFPHDAESCPLPVNTVESLKALANAGIEIGAHTRSHPNLGRVTDEATLFDEVVTATRELEAVIDRPVRYFAFPFGKSENISQRVIELCRQHAFEGIFFASNRWNLVGNDPYLLHRIHGDPSLARMKNWLTLDPRMLARSKTEFRFGAAGKPSYESTGKRSRGTTGKSTCPSTAS